MVRVWNVLSGRMERGGAVVGSWGVDSGEYLEMMEEGWKKKGCGREPLRDRELVADG